MSDHEETLVIPMHVGNYLLSIARTDEHTFIDISHTEHGHWATLSIKNRDGEVIHSKSIDCQNPDVGIAFMVSA